MTTLQPIPAPIPDVLRQKCLEVEGSSRAFVSSDSKATWSGYESGKILMWRGQESKYFWTSSNTGRFTLFKYQNGTEQAQIHLEHNFGKTAVVNDAAYFPISDSCHGVVVAVSDRGASKHPYFLAYFSLRSCSILKCIYIAQPVTCIYGVIDGVAENSVLQQLAEQFHTDWPHILLVGCRLGYVYLMHLGIEEEDISDEAEAEDDRRVRLAMQMEPTKPPKMVALSKIFYKDEMFVFQSDEGTTKCLEKEKVYVSALSYIEKSKVLVIGYNFGGIIAISLKTSKISSLLFIEGSVKFFALQEPEEDPRPILYMWTCFNVAQKGPVVVLLSVNFPKDEAETKNPSEYTFAEPVFIPALKWFPDNCSQILSMRTLHIDKRKNYGPIVGYGSGENLNNTSMTSQTSCGAVGLDTSLMLMTWIENRKGGHSNLHGTLFDLNSFYAKRLIGRVSCDSTIARQMHFFSRFSSTLPFCDTARGVLDVCAESTYRFAPPAFLKDSLDQLYYPSVHYITLNCLSEKRFLQLKVQPIQIQLIANISDNIASYFEDPTEPCKWVYAIGLANSAPAKNRNEERACLCRVLVHNFFPALLSFLEASAAKPDNLKWVEKWVWKEVGMTKTKFDDLCGPLFDDPPLELSPNARGFIHHARVFFKRASLILECISTIIPAFGDEDWETKIEAEYAASRQLCLFSHGIAFGLVYKLIPSNANNSRLFDELVTEFGQRLVKIKSQRKNPKILELLSETMKTWPDQSVWRHMDAEEWFPPSCYLTFLPMLLMNGVPESTKLTLLSYYCLEFEQLVERDSLQSKLFDKCLSFFMQEGFSLEMMKDIRNMHHEDTSLAHVDTASAKLLHRLCAKEKTKDESQLKWLPLCSPEEIEYARAEYMKLDYGVHKFNLNVIEKRRFNLIMEAPPATNPEPDFVLQSRAKCLEIRQLFPWMSKKIETLPQFMLDRYREGVAKESVEQENFTRITSRKRPYQSQIQLDVRHIDGAEVGGGRVSCAPGWKKALGGTHEDSDETIQVYEELPLILATPAKRSRLMLFPPTPTTATTGLSSTSKAFTELKKASMGGDRNARTALSERKSVRPKDMDRVNKVIQTPVSLSKSLSKNSRIPVRRHARTSRMLFPSGNEETGRSTTPPSTPPSKLQPTPTSILKPSERKSRISSAAKPRLRFALESRTEHIPSRAEKLLEEGKDTSFSTFAVLSSTESSVSSPSQLNELSTGGEPVQCEIVSAEGALTQVPNFEEQVDENEADDPERPARENEDQEIATVRRKMNESFEEQAEEDVVGLDEDEKDDENLVAVQDMEEQDAADLASAHGDEDKEEDEADAKDDEEEDKEKQQADGAFPKPKGIPAKSKKARKSVSVDSSDWVNTHLRRSSRVRSPRKLFDETKEFK